MNDRLQRLACAGIAVLALSAGGASAQLFKCKGPDGRTVYSDQRCDATQAAGNVGVKNHAHANDERAAAERAAAAKAAEQARLEAEARVAAERKLNGTPAAAPATSIAAPPVAPAASKPYVPTSSEAERIRSLELTMGSLGANAEQRTAARLEIDSIRQGRESGLSGTVRERRESLTADLSSTDAKKRRQALQDLRALYYQ